jgi:hypothetical protein
VQRDAALGMRQARGVIRSLPRSIWKFRNSTVTSQHTTWLPWSCASVRQQPSRCQPVSGSQLQGSGWPPSTLPAFSRLIS